MESEPGPTAFDQVWANTVFITEALMRIATPLLALSLLAFHPERATLTAQNQTAYASTRAIPDSIPVSVRWNRIVPSLAAQNRRPFLFRVYALLSVAQYAAVNAARDNRSVSPEAAIASASAAILNGIYTDSAIRAAIARELTRDLERARAGSHGPERAIAGQRLGEDVAARVIAWAPPPIPMIGPWSGTIPKGPGMWYSAPNVPPIGVGISSVRPWLLDSAAQFRPKPPPVYGSSTWSAALAEVKRVAVQRTPEQTRLAQLWNSSDPWARWNEEASAALTRHHASDADAARVLAVLNTGASDAIIACFEAKYHYWTIRPSQADTTIALADSVQLPNFPSFPSGHACSAGAFDAVLGHYFPQERAEFTRIAEEQAMSRLYGGIHYRFDDDEGLALGRVVARYAIQREKRGALNGWRTAQP